MKLSRILKKPRIFFTSVFKPAVYLLLLYFALRWGREAPKVRDRGGRRGKKKRIHAMEAEADAGETGVPTGAARRPLDTGERAGEILAAGCGFAICGVRAALQRKEGEVGFDAWCACGGAGFTGAGLLIWGWREDAGGRGELGWLGSAGVEEAEEGDGSASGGWTLEGSASSSRAPGASSSSSTSTISPR